MPGYNFTNDVRQALQAAREEAARLQHQLVEPSHILLGILRVPSGSCATAIARLGAEPHALYEAVSRVMPPPHGRVAGPDLPYTEGAKRVLEVVMREASDLHHSYVAQEHLILGVLASGDESGGILVRAGVTPERLRSIAHPQDGSKGKTGPSLVRYLPPSLVAWFALVIAVLALILAIRAQR